MVESDIRYYRRRAFEEMAAATRAVTPAARDRRLKLVDVYVDHLKALNAPSPFEDERPSMDEDLRSKSAAMSKRARIEETHRSMPADRPMEFLLRTGSTSRI